MKICIANLKGNCGRVNYYFAPLGTVKYITLDPSVEINSYFIRANRFKQSNSLWNRCHYPKDKPRRMCIG